MTSTRGATAWSRRTARPLQRFLHTEAGSASLLLAATIAALVWANSPFADSYEDLWGTYLEVSIGDATLREDLRHWVNDGLMVFFFFVVGLEIRREFSMGELTERGRAAIPAVAALAGMVVPALLYTALNAGGEGARGWGIVMATDIAFVLGLLALLGPRCPSSLRVFLLTLAIIDDIGAITVVAVFYSDDIDLLALAIAGAVVPVIFVINRVRLWRGPAYFVAGLVLWVAMHESGVHPTLAGVLVGVLVAVFPPARGDVERAARLTRSFRQAPTPQLARSATLSVTDSVSPNERLQTALHPWTSYVVVPLFALANAGVAIDGDMLSRAAQSPVTLGILLGLVVGKTVGISLASFGAVRLGLGSMPESLGRRQLVGGAALAGIGFTVSLFITDLAFDDPRLQEEAKIGVLVASLIAAVLATLLFRFAERGGEGVEPDRPATLARPVDPDLDHIRGRVDAPLTLVEYADFECPFCGRATGVVEDLLERFGDDLRYVFRHVPNDEVHPNARLAAEAAEAAGAQGLFWELHDRLFARQDELSWDVVIDEAQALGVDLDRFIDDLQEGVHRAHVDLDLESAQAGGVRGTPTFFVGDRRHEGPWDAETLGAALERLRTPASA
jgi:Na+:H+ antiporter, NhaA family